MGFTKESEKFKGTYDGLSGEMTVQIVKEKEKYIIKCMETKHPKSFKIYSTETDINTAMDKYLELSRLASL